MKIDADVAKLASHFTELKVDFSDAPGSCCWIAACKSWQWRAGPQSYPLPGISCFIWPQDTAPITIQALVMLANGIVLKDLAKSLESDSGLECFKEQGTVFTMPAGMLAFIPNGVIAFPVYAPVDNFEKAEKSKKEVLDVGCVCHVPLFSPCLFRNLPDNVAQAITQYNLEHLSKQKTLRPWTARCEVFDQFVAKVKDKAA